MLTAANWRRAVAFAVAIPALMPVNPAAAGDKAVCYKGSSPVAPTFRLVLDVKKHSDLTTSGPRQTVYSALGKHSYVDPYYKVFMAVTHGGVVVSQKDYKNPSREFGAHLGLISEFVRPASDPIQSPVNFDCTTSELSATPYTWQCNILPPGGPSYQATLTQVYSSDPLCAAFQDGGGSVYPPPYGG